MSVLSTSTTLGANMNGARTLEGETQKLAGLVSSGVSNDVTGALQAVLQKAFDNGTFYIRIAPGRYKVTALTVPDGVTVYAYGAIFERTSVSDLNLVTLGNNSVLRGGEYVYTDAANDHAPSENATAIMARGVEGANVFGAKISGAFYVGVKFDLAQDCSAVGVTARGVVNRAFYAYREAGNIDFQDCAADGRKAGANDRFTAYGFNMNAAGTGIIKNVRFVACTARNCVSQGFAGGTRNEGCSMTACIAENVQYYGFLLQDANGTQADGISLTACQSLDCGVGLYMVGVERCNVASMVIKRSTWQGIYLYGASLNKVSAIVSNSGNDGLLLVADPNADGANDNHIEVILANGSGTGYNITANCTGNKVLGIERGNAAASYDGGANNNVSGLVAA